MNAAILVAASLIPHAFGGGEVVDLLLIIEPVTHEVLGDLEWRRDRYVFVDCSGAEYDLRAGYRISPTQDLCAP